MPTAKDPANKTCLPCTFTITVNEPDNLCNSSARMHGRTQAGDMFTVTAYPNPISDGMRLTFSCTSFTEADVSIYDLTGRTIETDAPSRQMRN